MNKRKRLIWLWLLLGSISSCNRFSDLQPVPDNGPQPASVESLTQLYPRAQAIQFTTIRPNQLWRATFTQDRQRYQAVTSPVRLLLSEQLLDSPLPDSLTRLLGTTALAGGTLSNPRIRFYGRAGSWISQGTELYPYADYTWQQQRYTARWSIANPTTGRPYYNLELMPYQLAEYESDRLADIPESIQRVLQQEGLVFTYAWIQVGEAGKRQYRLLLKQPKWPATSQYGYLTYDDDGQLLMADRTPDSAFFQRVDQLPPTIQAYLKQTELAGFDINPASGLYGYSTRYSYGSVSTYRISLAKGKQGWQLVFSGNGQLLERSFLMVGEF